MWCKIRGHPWWPGHVVQPDDAVLKARGISRLHPDERLVHFFADNDNVGKVHVHNLEDYAAGIRRAQRADSRLKSACTEALEWFNTNVVRPQPPGTAANQLSSGFDTVAQTLKDIVDCAKAVEPPPVQTPEPMDATTPDTNDLSSEFEDALRKMGDALRQHQESRKEARHLEDLRVKLEAEQREFERNMFVRLKMQKEVQASQVKATQVEAEVREMEARKEALNVNGELKMESIPVVVRDIQQQGPLGRM